MNPSDRVSEVETSVGFSRQRAVEHHRNGEPIEHAMSPKTAQRRAHEGLESNEGRHRVARQPEDRHPRVRRDAEGEWFARFHRDLHRARPVAAEFHEH